MVTVWAGTKRAVLLKELALLPNFRSSECIERASETCLLSLIAGLRLPGISQSGNTKFAGPHAVGHRRSQATAFS